MDKKRFFVGLIVFGSMWGFSECIVGSRIADTGLPSGAIMTGLFAMVFLVMSRMIFQQRGMQIGMGLVAGGLRLFNPFGGCHLCSALAIMAEGFIFELIMYYAGSIDLAKFRSLTYSASLGIFSAYCIYVGGYIVTQILTPLSFGSFYLVNFVSALPQMLAGGVIPALMGGVVVPILVLLPKMDISIRDKLYYPTAIGVSTFCWVFVVGNWFLYIM